jgi:PKD repeat protein
VTVTDNAGLSSTVPFALTVGVQAITASYTGPSSAAVGTSTAYSVSAADPNPGAILSYAWTFGDGSSTQAGNPINHTYSATGSYSGQVVISDQYGASRTVPFTVTVGVQPLVASFTGPQSLLAGVWGTYTDGKPVDPNPGGVINTWTWTFSDGTAPTTNHVHYLSHAFRKTGTFTLTLTLSDQYGALGTSAYTIKVTAKALIAKITGPTALGVGVWGTYLDADQNDTNPGALLKTWTWNFGDGTATTTTTAHYLSHPFRRTGTFKITLTVKDSYGLSATTTLTVKVTGKAPTIKLTGPTTLALKKTGTYTAAGTKDANPGGTITKYTWNFGDGTTTASTGTTTSRTHAYTKKGTYKLTLTATDYAGLTATKTLTIKIT